MYSLVRRKQLLSQEIKGLLTYLLTYHHRRRRRQHMSPES